MNPTNRPIARELAARNQTGSDRRRRQWSAQVEGLESRVLMSSVQAAIVPPVPAAPASLTAIAASPTSVSLHWVDADKLATGFIVLRATDGVHFSELAAVTNASAVTCVDNTALSFHTYTYEVEEENGTSVSKASSPASATTPLNTPAAPTALALGPTSVQLTWTVNEPSATGYVVLRSTNGANFSQVAAVGKVTAYVDAAAVSGTQYAYEIQAVNGSNASTVSKPVVITTSLVAPSSLASAFSNGAVALTWTDNDANAAGYCVLRSINGTTFTQVANLTGGTASTFVDTNVLTGHTYYYKVQAYAVNTTSAASAALTVNTPLTAPSGLVATAAGTGTVNLTWTDNDPNALGYAISRGTDGVHFTSIARLTGANLAAYSDKTAVSGTTYYYEICAYANLINSSQTNIATATTPLAAPAALTAVALGPTSVKLTWPAGDVLATGYAILRSTDGVNFAPIAAVTGRTTLVYTDSTVSSATSYTYEVLATNANNSSAVSKTAAVTTPLLAPTALAATVSGSTVNLAWTDNDPAAAGYYVLRSADGKAFTLIANLTNGAVASYSDTSSVTGHAYAYEVQAYLNTDTSAVTAPASVSVALFAPTNLAATANNANSVTLTWTDNDPDASAYNVLRSTDGTHFTAVGKVSGAAVATCTDTTAVSGQSYTYEVQAVNGAITSPASNPAAVTMPLATPVSLVATATGPQSVKLTWTNKDPLATGYALLRSSNGQPFTQITQISSVQTTTYVDTTVSTATVYSYEVQATNASNQSAATKSVAVTTPLMAPTALAAAAQSGVVQLTWTDVDPNATGYTVLRSAAGKAYAPIAALTGGAADSYSDTSALTGHAYSYEVQASAGAIVSVVSAPATISVPLSAPSSLAAAATAAGVALTWADNDPNALGYIVFRSTDGTHFTPLASLTGAAATTYTDATALSATSYTYEVEAVAGTIVSPASNPATITTPLSAPATLAATLTGGYVTLAWVDKDPTATGYTVLRSTDGNTFTAVGTLGSATANSYVDTSVASGATYYYQVQASSASNSSRVSNTAKIVTPAGNPSNGVSVTTRFGDELVVTAAGTSDSVSITESGSTLTISGDGQTFTDPAPAAGLFVYTRGGSDSVSIGQSVTTRTTVDSIDNAKTIINTAGSNVSVWDDSTDTVIGSATVHSIASFAGGVSKALGASLPNPTDAGTTAKQNLSLFGTGPVAADANQGESGDCYFISSLAAFANQEPQVIYNSAVDLGDGTYAVEFHASNGNPVYVRVNNSLTTGNIGGFYFAHPGSNDTIWAAIMEKAFCCFRTGANTYASINAGAMPEVYSDLGVNSTSFTPSTDSNAALYTLLSNDLNNHEAITLGTQNAPNLVSDHAYALLGVSQVNGVNMYTVRNPWGVQGDSLENSAGIATLTYSQFVANFVFGTIAST